VSEFSVIAESAHEGSQHPVAWTRKHGPSRAAVDLLGHGPESFESEGHRALVSGLARWAIRQPE
jgi:type 1 glutamine amidotransferase